MPFQSYFVYYVFVCQNAQNRLKLNKVVELKNNVCIQGASFICARRVFKKKSLVGTCTTNSTLNEGFVTKKDGKDVSVFETDPQKTNNRTIVSDLLWDYISA